jgi:hypothetical protein
MLSPQVSLDLTLSWCRPASIRPLYIYMVVLDVNIKYGLSYGSKVA